MNPSSWTDRPSTGLWPPWPVKADKAIKLANAIADAFVALGWQEDEEDQRWGGDEDDGEVPDPPHGAREDDNLPFDDAGFVNDSPDDTIPDYHLRRPAQPSSRASHRLEGPRVWTSPNRRSSPTSPPVRMRRIVLSRGERTRPAKVFPRGPTAHPLASDYFRGAAEQALELRASLSLTSAAAEQASQ